MENAMQVMHVMIHCTTSRAPSTPLKPPGVDALLHLTGMTTHRCLGNDLTCKFTKEQVGDFVIKQGGGNQVEGQENGEQM